MNDVDICSLNVLSDEVEGDKDPTVVHHGAERNSDGVRCSRHRYSENSPDPEVGGRRTV